MEMQINVNTKIIYMDCTGCKAFYYYSFNLCILLDLAGFLPATHFHEYNKQVYTITCA